MLTSKPVYRYIDCDRESDITSLLPKAPIRSSHSTHWKGLKLVHYQQPACQTDELSFSQHVVSINIGNTVVKERRLQGQYQIDDFRAGDISITPAHMLRQVHLMGASEFIHLYISPLSLNHFAHESCQAGVELQPQFKIQDALIYQTALALKQELNTNPPHSPFYAESAATFLTAHLIQNYATQTILPWKHPHILAKQTLQCVVGYVAHHLDEDLSLNTLADLVEMSPFSLARAFKQSTGQTLHQYIIQYRIAQAKRLLAQPQHSITDISLQVGFQSHSYFSTVFRRTTGVTPRDYRRQRLT